MSSTLKVLFGTCLILAALTRVRAYNWEIIKEPLYQNYPLYQIHVESNEQMKFVQEIEDSSDSLIFLQEIGYPPQDLSIVVAPHKVPDFLNLLKYNGIRYELLEKNVQRLLEKDAINKYEPLGRHSTSPQSYNWSVYHDLATTYEWLRSLPAQYPNISEVINYGRSYEGEDLLALKISWPQQTHDNAPNATKPIIFLESGIHAREWIAPATATYLINELLSSTNPNIQNIARSYDWYIVPHVNPDGYVYTHTTDRLWRKNRKPFGSCYGVDLNRNWDYVFFNNGKSPCASGYAGPEAFSEVEVKSLADLVKRLKPNVKLYLSLHSFSQLLMYPYGFTESLPENVLDLHQVGQQTAAAIKQRFGTEYKVGTIRQLVQKAFGNSMDWAYDSQNIRMSFCFELRPLRSNWHVGHMLPSSEIIPTAQETLDGLIAMCKEIERRGYF